MVACEGQCSDQEASSKSVDTEESMWTLDEDWDGNSDATHNLMISLVRPAVTSEEVIWKKGRDKHAAEPNMTISILPWLHHAISTWPHA